MQRARLRTFTTLTLAAVGLLALVACSSADEPEATKKPQAEATASAEETPQAAASAVADQAVWANPVTNPGEVISTFSIGDITVEVSQVGVVPATKAGSFVTPEGTPIIAEGDDIVLVNYVITNNGDAVDLGSSLVVVDPVYDDWPYMQGMDSIVDYDLYDANGINKSELGPDGYSETNVYTFEPGASYSVGGNFRHQAGSPITFEGRFSPADSNGDLIHDLRVEGSGTGVIK